MSYTVLARRYRSQTFDDVIGQDAIAQTLKNAIKTGKVAHAYLFTGTRGVGKTTMARILAKSLNCLKSKEPTADPCCKCESCLAVNAGEDIDVIEIDGASNRGIDNIRELRQNAIYRPARARYKVYIIDEVHMLTTEAFNALLKILEEPPEHVKFIFATTEPNKVLPTIQSRCQRFDFNAINPKMICEQLKKILKTEKIKFEDDLILHLARLANGSMRDALSLLDQLISTGNTTLTVELLEEFLGQPNRERIYLLLDKIGSTQADEVLTELDRMLKTGLTPTLLTDSLIDSMRDLLVVKSTDIKTELVILTSDEQGKIASLIDRFDTPALIYSITALEKLRWNIKNADNPRALLEATILRLTLSEHFMDIKTLYNRLKNSPSANSSQRQSPVAGVKKKSTESGESSTASIETNEPPIQHGPVLTGPANIECITACWSNIVSAVKSREGAAAAFLDSAKPISYDNNVLTLSFASSAKFQHTMCLKRLDRLQIDLGDVIGTELMIKTEIASQQDKTGDKTQRPSHGRIGQEEKKQALSDEEARTLLSGLDARVTEIEKVQEN